MKKFAIVTLAFLVAYAGLYFYAFHNTDLRGWWRSSHDGKTYLVIEDTDGGSANNPCTLDGRPWPYAVGELAEIEPGCHELACPAKVSFCVKPGVEYHFDYWGP
jgi:hypothetical protein